MQNIYKKADNKENGVIQISARYLRKSAVNSYSTFYKKTTGHVWLLKLRYVLLYVLSLFNLYAVTMQ